MFVIHCPTCQNRQLVGTRSITSFRNTDDGPVLSFRCPKGHEARWPAPPANEESGVDEATPIVSGDRFDTAPHPSVAA